MRVPVMTLLLTLVAWLGTASAALPGVNVKDLDAEDLASLSKLMNEGACPCDAKKSLMQCIEQKSCPAATELANFGADKIREGLGANQVAEAVIKRYLSDHVTFDFDLSKTPFKGAADGKIVLVEFADFECPHCALMKDVVKKVVKAYPNDVKVYFKHFPIQHHQFAETAARATLAAHRQQRFWPMHDLIFDNQSTLSADSFKGFAIELGMNVERFEKDLKDPAIAAQVQKDRQEGIEAQITGTPMLYINNKMYLGEKTPEKIGAKIKALLGKK